MIIPIPSHNKPFSLRMRIHAFIPLTLGVIAYDSTRPNTDYLRRKVPFSEQNDGQSNFVREITLNFPISPERFTIEIYNKETNSDYGFKVHDIALEELDQSELWAEPQVHDFIKFAEDFAQKAGYIDGGYYDSPDSQFLIHYVPVIRDQFGSVKETPARIHRVTGRIQIAQSFFRRFTIPIRMFVLLHERMHFQVPTRDQIRADLSALKIYLDLAYPSIEAVYALTKIFGMYPQTVGLEQMKRTERVIEFIKDHKKERQLKKAA